MRRRVAIGLGLHLLVASAVLAQDAGVFGVRFDWVPISGAERNDVAGQRLRHRDAVALAPVDHGLLRRTCPPPRHARACTTASRRARAALRSRSSRSRRPRPARVAGNVDLTREQRDALLAGHLYIQLHAARGVAPDNAVLWGWLLTSQSTEPCAAL